MCIRPYGIAAALLLATQAGLAQVAPDGSLAVQVVHQRHATGDAIEVHSVPQGKRLWARRADKLTVEQIAWTPDSWRSKSSWRERLMSLVLA